MQEVYPDLVTVDVALEVQQEGFNVHHDRLFVVVVESRVVTYVDSSAVPAAVHEGAGGIDAASGEDGSGLDLEVGRRHAQRAAPPETDHHRAVGGRRAAEDAAHLFQRAGLQQAADASRTDRPAAGRSQRQRDGAKTKLRACFFKCPRGATAAGPESEVGADHHDFGVQRRRENGAAELGGALSGKLGGEGQHKQLVRMQAGQQGDLHFGRREQAWLASRRDKRQGMPVEGEDGADETLFPGDAERGLDYLLVADVHAVEGADGHRARAGTERFEGGVQIHAAAQKITTGLSSRPDSAVS